MPENLVSRDGFRRAVQRQPAHLHTQAESGAYLRDSSRVPRRRPFIKPPYAIRSVPSLSGYAIAHRWRSLPRVRRHRASKPQGSSERVLPWQVTMDQLVFTSLSHTHYWYEMGMLKVPAVRKTNSYGIGSGPGILSDMMLSAETYKFEAERSTLWELDKHGRFATIWKHVAARQLESGLSYIEGPSRPWLNLCF